MLSEVISKVSKDFSDDFLIVGLFLLVLNPNNFCNDETGISRSRQSSVPPKYAQVTSPRTAIKFAGLFGLVWILKRYTHFEKHRIPRGPLPTFPYGNFRDVIRHEKSLHEFLWKHYKRFRAKKCKYGGLFIITKPVILLTDAETTLNINNNNKSCAYLFPCDSKLDKNDVIKMIDSGVLISFVEKYDYSLKGELVLKLLKYEVPIVLKEVLLESSCQIFGFRSIEIAEDINQLLNEKYAASLRFYLSLCVPFIPSKQNNVNSSLKEMFEEIVDDRKKNDFEQNDLIQSFKELHNERHNITQEIFNLFADTLTYSYSTLMFCFYEMANNQIIQEELVGEIRRFNKKYRKLTYENVGELVYLEAVVKETLRKYPPVATVLASCNDHACLPNQDTLIFQSILGIHRDPQYYTKPEAFDPDRFTDEQHGFKKDVYMPFGPGVKNYMCMKIVSLQVKLILVTIFTSLQVKHKDGARRSLKYDPYLLYLSPSENFEFSFEISPYM